MDENWIISRDTDDMVVKAPKNPTKRRSLVVSLISRNLKKMKQIRKHPMKFAIKVLHDIGSEGAAKDTPYLKTAPMAPPRATIAI